MSKGRKDDSLSHEHPLAQPPKNLWIFLGKISISNTYLTLKIPHTYFVVILRGLVNCWEIPFQVLTCGQMSGPWSVTVESDDGDLIVVSLWILIRHCSRAPGYYNVSWFQRWHSAFLLPSLCCLSTIFPHRHALWWLFIYYQLFSRACTLRKKFSSFASISLCSQDDWTVTS